MGGCVAGGVWQRGACVAGGVHGRGGHAWQGVRGTHAPPTDTLRDTVNERAVRILLECILVLHVIVTNYKTVHGTKMLSTFRFYKPLFVI